MPNDLFRQLLRRFAPQRLRPCRREFLGTLTLGTAAGLLGACANSRPTPVGPRVVIVGAGLAGLACAHELEAAGFHVTLLEARRRTGGRVRTWYDFVPGKTVEAGGERIGANHACWKQYADRFCLSLLTCSDEERPYPLFLEGRRLSETEARQVFESMEDVLAKMTREAALVNAYEPWRTPDAPLLDAISLSARFDGLHLPPLARRALEIQFANDRAVDCDRQSYLANLAVIRGGGLDDFWAQSERYRCQQGNEALAWEFTRRLRPRTLRPGTSAARIQQEDSRIMVITRGGERFDADHVVLTAPPSVWGRIEFIPRLPMGLVPQMGAAVKYVTRFPTPFWTASGESPKCLADGAIGKTWEATAGQPGDGTALVGFSGGSAAQISREGGSREQRTLHARRMEILYPGFTHHQTGQRFVDWLADPWTQGGYSFPAPGELTRIGPMLQQGFHRLHFAGEHTCPAFVGQMEGALHSGIRVAWSLAQSSP